MKSWPVIFLLLGCVSRNDAPEAIISREARSRWTQRQARELNQAVEQWRDKR